MISKRKRDYVKIMFVAPGFMEKGKPAAGMSNYIYRIAKALLEKGNEIIIIAGGYRINRCTLIDKIRVYEVATKYNNFTSSNFEECIIKPLCREYEIQKAVHSICKQEKVDIIQYAGNTGNGIFHHVRIPSVMRMSSYFRFTYGSYLTYSKTQVELYSLLERLAAKRMNSVYAPSKILADAFSIDVKRKVPVIETPYFNDTVEDDSSIYDLRLQGKKYILYYGRIEPDKGVYLIAKIAKRLLKKHNDYYLVFIGRDCYVKNESTLKNIKNEIGNNERVIYLKEMTHDKLYPIIRESAMVLMPSYKENLSNACMETMEMKKIVIATNGASYEQLITDKKNGFLFQMGDSEDLLKKIETVLLLSNEEKERISENAKQRITKLYPERKLEKLLQYYQKVIDNDSRKVKRKKH